MTEKIHNRDYYTYRCKHCGAECVSKPGLASGLPKTKLGSYGNATPTPKTYDEEVYEADTISFIAASGDDPAKINDSAKMFGEKHFHGDMVLVIETTSGTNDGTYTIAERGVLAGVLSLVSTDSLTTENAATAGTVTINRRIYQPNITTGCPFCGSLNSR